MRQQRHTEVNVLGYRIDRVRSLDAAARVDLQWYEVLAPDSAELLGSYAQRAEAERAIVARELDASARPAAA